MEIWVDLSCVGHIPWFTETW